MSVPTLILAAVAAAAVPSDGGDTALSCNLTLPDGSQFRLEGHFNEDGLQSNLSDLTQVEGVFARDPGIVITTDGTFYHRWSKEKVDAMLTQYGSGVSILTVEKRTFVGRHDVRNLLGVGLCDMRDEPGERAS
jgi:hypothetical protein